MKSNLFYTDEYLRVEQRVVDYLNANQGYLSASTIKSTRAVGDAIQDILAESFQKILADERIIYSTGFARRAMADLAFEDHEGFYYVVDVKTHRLHDTKFNMPNLTSVERLTRFFEDDKNYFVLLFISYEVEGIQIAVRQVRFVPIEFLGWDCLTLGALGWGQIQIINSNSITLKPGYSRRAWMMELCDNLLEFYPKEINKIGQRIEHFKRVREYWEKKPEA
jgi:hypothetical protein